MSEARESKGFITPSVAFAKWKGASCIIKNVDVEN